jgi:outer membrane protein assembly factor BamB
VKSLAVPKYLIACKRNQKKGDVLMLKRIAYFLAVALSISLSAAAQGPRRIALGDWPEQRGPRGDGTSQETGLIGRWEMNGENFLWRAPYGGRSAPIVMGNRVYVQNASGRGPQLQERVMALDADTGSVVWEYKYNLYQSDVPTHRIAWASPAADPETGNIYALSGGAELIALSPDGKLLWSRAFGEEYAAFTTHGGRTMSPLIDGDLVIIGSPISNWGSNAGRTHRLVGLDKRTGEIVYVSSPGGRPYDTAYGALLIATIDGMRMLIAGLGDGGFYAIEPQTGRKLWGYMSSKRGINTGVAVSGSNVFISHGDENLNVNELGMVAAIDGTKRGDILEPRWSVRGFEFAYSSPVTDGTALYQIDNGSNLMAFDGDSGRRKWALPLGNAQKAPPVLADGKIYVGTDGGAFFIVRPHEDRGEILSNVTLPVSASSCCGSEGTPEQILGGAAVARGRIYFVSSDAVYAIGSRQAKQLSGWAVDEPAQRGEGSPAHLQIVPAEAVVEPGAQLSFRARVFDDKGRLLREENTVAWSMNQLSGAFSNGTFTVASEPKEQAGVIRGTADGLTGESRVRVVRPLPWTETFESYTDGASPPGWVNLAVSQVAVTTVDGEKVLEKKPIENIFKRTRVFIGPSDWSDYTFEADVRTPMRRRQMADLGITVQRYTLALYGTIQKLKLEPWEPETTRTITVPFSWKPDAWYRMKLRVQNLANGSVQVQGKAWAVEEPEPSAWMIDYVDPIGNRQGAPGLYLNAEFGAYLDNFKLSANQ